MPRTDPRVLTATPRAEGLDAAVAAARRVVASLLQAGPSAEQDLDAVAAQLGAVADGLALHAVPHRAGPTDPWSREGLARRDPVTGPENAIAPPLQLVGCDDGSVVGTVELGAPYQGPPGHVHGGVSALLLDHALGVANGFAGTAGMTGQLQLRYHQPTPLFVPLEVRAWQVRVEGRKIWTEGSISVDGARCVSAEGLFLAPQPR